MNDPAAPTTFPDSPDSDGDPSWRQDAIEMVRTHISFGVDGGLCRGDIWDNLVDTLGETRCLHWFEVVERYFYRVWPSGN